MELALPQTPASSPRGGPQKGGHAHGAAVRGVQRGGAVCGGLGHEHQVEVRVVGGVEEDLPQHGTPQAHRLRRSAGREDTEDYCDLPMNATDKIQAALFSCVKSEKHRQMEFGRPKSTLMLNGRSRNDVFGQCVHIRERHQ